MKPFRKTLVWLLGGVICLFLAADLYSAAYGRALVQRLMARFFQRPVRVEGVRLTFPAALIFHRLEVKGVLRAEWVRVDLGFPAFIRDKRIHFSSVTLHGAEVRLHADRQGRFWDGVSGLLEAGSKPSNTSSGTGSPDGQLLSLEGVCVDRLSLKQGRARYWNTADGNSWTLDQLDVDFRNLFFPPVNTNSPFEIRSVFIGGFRPFSGSRIQGRGTINPAAGNMDGRFQVNIPGRGSGVTARLHSVHNDLSVKGRLTLGPEGIPAKPEHVQKGSFIDALAGIVAATETGLDMEFAFRTKMDHPQIEKVQIRGALSVSDRVALPEKTLISENPPSSEPQN